MLVLLAVVLVFVLARTEVGRTQLRAEIERRFDARFAGRLEIGRLDGNLLRTFYARDVRLLDDRGRPVLQVDSVVVAPSWRMLLGREVAARSLALYRPDLRLVRDTSGTWNLRRALSRSAASGPDDGEAFFDFAGATVRIYDGRISTRSHGPPARLIEQGWVFDYTHAEVRDLDARLEIDWTEERRITVRRLAAVLPDQHAQVTMTDGHLMMMGEEGWRVRNLAVQAASASSADPAPMTASLDLTAGPAEAAPQLAIHLERGTVNNALVRRLIPRYPLEGTMRASLQAHGTLSELTVEYLMLTRGGSRLHAAGTVRGLPDEAAFDGPVVDTRLAAEDVAAVWPGAPLDRWEALGALRLDAEATGRVPLQADTQPRPFRLHAQIVAVSDSAGALAGTVALHRAAGQPLRYRAGLEADSLHLSALLPDAQGTQRQDAQMSGRLRAEGRGLNPRTLAGTLDLALTEARWNGHAFEGVRLEAKADSGRLAGTLRLEQDGGRLWAGGSLTLGERPTYRARLVGRRLDLSALLPGDAPATPLSGALELEAAGASWDALSGRLTASLDSSAILQGDTTRRLPPQDVTVRVAPRASDAPRLRLTGDALALTLRTDASASALRAVGALWADAFARAFRETTSHTYAARDTAAADTTAPLLTLDPVLRARARRLLEANEAQQIALDARLEVHRAEALAALWPALDSVHTDLTAQMSLTAGADRFATTGRAQGDTLRLAALDAFRPRMALHAQADLRGDSNASRAPLQVDLQSTADSLRLGAQAAFAEPVIEAHLSGRRGRLTMRSEARGAAGPFRLRLALALRPDRVRLTVEDAYLAAGDYVWTNLDAHPVDLYAGAVHLPGLRLVSEGGEQLQELRLHGTFSAAPTDTVFVEARALRLRSLSDLLGLERPVGGRLDGRVALTGGLQHPELTGRVTARRLSFDGRLLGRLEASSRYVPGAPEVALSASLHPALRPADGADGADGDSSAAAGNNRLRLRGTFRLPGLRDAPSSSENPGAAGALDLTYRIDRADLFFLEYLFEDTIGQAGGHLAGRGTLRGTFYDPVFNADLRAADARVTIPRFNLTYAGEGRLRVDRDGITVRDATVTDPTGGTATVSGRILFNDYDYFSFDLRARLDALQIIDVAASQELPFYGTIWASGPVLLTGPLDDALLRAPMARTTPESELLIPITETAAETDTGFLVFADSTGRLPDLERTPRRRSLLDDRPDGERTFLDGLDMDLNILAPEGSAVHLVFDPLVGDVIHAVGSGRIQLLRRGGEVTTYGAFEITSGDYMFTAGEVFYRRFVIDRGTITWDGPPANAELDITASYRTRASTAGLDLNGAALGRIPLIVRLHITGRVALPDVALSLAVDRSRRAFMEDYAAAALETILNQSGRETEYATSVLLTNTFLLASPTRANVSLAGTGNRLVFNSVSQLVASQLNRYLSAALPSVDFNLGVQGENPQDLDVIYGVALRLLDERLIIRGEGVMADRRQTEQQSLEGEFVVEVRLTPSVSVEAFYRREGSILSDQALTSTTGAGLSYQTQFPTWRRLIERLFGWLTPDAPREESVADETVADAAGE